MNNLGKFVGRLYICLDTSTVLQLELSNGLSATGGRDNIQSASDVWRSMSIRFVSFCEKNIQMWGTLKKEKSRRPRNRNPNLYVRILALAVEALIPLRHKAVNGCLLKFPGLRCEPASHVLLDVVVRSESFAAQSLFYGTKNCTIARRERSVLYCIFGFKGSSTSQVIGARNEMMMDDYDGQMLFGDLREVWIVWRVTMLDDWRMFLLAFNHVTCTRDPQAASIELPLFVTHPMILSPVCTFQTPARFFLNTSGSFLF